MRFPVWNVRGEAQLSPKRDITVDQVGSIEHRVDIECVVSEDHGTINAAEVKSLMD